jgi:hypothetical protein
MVVKIVVVMLVAPLDGAVSVTYLEASVSVVHLSTVDAVMNVSTEHTTCRNTTSSAASLVIVMLVVHKIRIVTNAQDSVTVNHASVDDVVTVQLQLTISRLCTMTCTSWRTDTLQLVELSDMDLITASSLGTPGEDMPFSQRSRMKY